jgi:hypothetical protein
MTKVPPGPAADIKPEMPEQPDLIASKLSIANFSLLVEFFDGLSYAALEFINLPEFQNTQAENDLDRYWGHYINGMWCRVLDEIEAGVQANNREAEIRAKLLLKHFVEAEHFEPIEAPVAPYASKNLQVACARIRSARSRSLRSRRSPGS